MCSLVSAEPSTTGCGVCASWPSGMTRSDSFSTPLRPPCRICGVPPLTKADRRLSKTRSMPGRLMMSLRLPLPARAARKHLEQHGEIPAQTVERMAERGRRVVLEEEVPGPRRQVARRHRAQQPRPAPARERERGAGERQQRAGQVQPARGAVGVLRKVVRVELAEVREARLHRWSGGRRHGGHGAPAATAVRETLMLRCPVGVVVARCFRASCRFAGHPRKYAPGARHTMIGIIGGTGLYQMAELAAPRAQEMTTPFGPPSAPPLLGTLRGHAVAFLARHGLRHQYLPGEINFRANIWALKSLGVRTVIGVSAVGSLR